MQKMSQRPHSYLNYINMIWRVEWFLCERFFTKFKVHHGSSLYIYIPLYPNWPLAIESGIAENTPWILTICPRKVGGCWTAISAMVNNGYSSFWLNCHKVRPFGGFPMRSIIRRHDVSEKKSSENWLVPRNPWRIHLHSAQLILTG